MGQQYLPGHDEPPADEAGKADKPKYQYRFQENGAEWAVDLNGHYRVLSCGDIRPGVVAKIRRTGRKCRVRALLPGIGKAPRPVIVVVAVAPSKAILKEFPDAKPLIGMFFPDELEV
jgi:hypothetical protein